MGESIPPATEISQSLSLSLGSKDYVSYDKHGSKRPAKQGETEVNALKFQEQNLKISGLEENLLKSKKQMAIELCLLIKNVSTLMKILDYLEIILGIRSKIEAGSPAMSQVLSTAIIPSPNPHFSNFFEAPASTRRTGDLGDMVSALGSSEPVGGSFTNMMREGTQRSDAMVPTHLGLATPCLLPPK